MIADRAALTREGSKLALQWRETYGYKLDRALDIFELAEKANIDIWFQGTNSLSGFYIKAAPPRVVLGAMRPPGRRAFTCAHEVGHHAFGHGTRGDLYLEDEERVESTDPTEILANAFASVVLMSPGAVRRAFAMRGWDDRSPSARSAYIVSEVLGVGYTTLLNHMAGMLKRTAWPAVNQLKRVRPKNIQAELWPFQCAGRVVPVDRWWQDRPVDLEVGDVVLLPLGTTWSDPVVDRLPEHEGQVVAVAATPGTAALTAPDGWRGVVRVARRHYVGRSCWRFLADPDPDAEETDVP